MTITTAKTSSRRSGASTRLKAAVLTAALGLSLTAGNVQAQAVVEIGGNLFTNIANQVNTLATQIQEKLEFAQQATRWTRTLQQFQDMMNSIDSLITGLGLPTGVKLEKVKPDFMVVERCGGAGGVGGVLSGLAVSVIGFDPDKDNVKKAQQQVCIMDQRMRNQQYNEMVDYMTTTMAQMNTAKSKLEIARGTGTRTSGQMDNAIYDVQKVNGEMQRTKEEFESRMTAYNTFLEAQAKTQATLAQVAMRGKPSVLGQVMKAAALETALKVNESD